jgi:hypothetical protein
MANTSVDPTTMASPRELPGRIRALHPATRPLELGDSKAVGHYLASFDSFAQSPREGQIYVELALRRFIITTLMVPPPRSFRRSRP